MKRLVTTALSGAGGAMIGIAISLHAGLLAVGGFAILGAVAVIERVAGRPSAIMRRVDKLEEDDRLAAEFAHNVLCTAGKWPHEGVCGVLHPDMEIKPGVTRRQRLYESVAWGYGRVFPAPGPIRCEDR